MSEFAEGLAVGMNNRETNGGCFGNGWGDGWWIILLFLCGMGGWGMNGGFGGGYEFPWLLNGQNGINNNVSDGFRSAQLSDGITSVRDGINNLSTQLCGCSGEITSAITGAQSAISNQLYNNEIASLNRSFSEQTANAQGFNAVQSGLCDIRYGNATNTRDIIESQTRGTQAILDKLCALELDGYKRENDNLRQQLTMADLKASQTAQNAFISQGFANEVDQLYTRLSNCPVPSVPVYGRQPIFNCGNSGCGCGNSN